MQQPILEKVHPDAASSIKAFAYDAASFDIPYHFHPEYELTYIQSSTGLRYVGNSIEDYYPGELVLIGKNLPHCWKNRLNEPAQRAKSLVIQWKKELIGKHQEFQQIHQHLGIAQRGIKYKIENRHTYESRLLNLIDATPIESYLILIRLLSDLAMSQNYILLTDQTSVSNPTNEFSEKMDVIYNYVEANYTRRIRLQEVADQIFLSEQSFSRFFSMTMGKPFFKFLNEYRINVASRLLLETSLSINEIGYRCGYDSAPFFYRQFKKYKSKTPLNYRKTSRSTL